MPGFIDPSQIDFNGKQVMALSEMIIEEAFSTPTLAQIHTPVKGIVAKQQIGYLSQLSGLVGKLSTGCEIDTDTNVVSMHQKLWTPAFIEGRFVQCWKNLIPSFWVWGLKNGVNKSDLTTGDFFNFISQVIGVSMNESWLRLAWFGDTGALHYNTSPAGVITNAVDLGYFTPINGFWEQLQAIVATTPARLTGDISAGVGIATRNAQASYAAQAFTASDTTNMVATETLANMKYGSDFRLRDKANLQYLVTQSFFDQYARELRKVPNVEGAYERIEGGYTALHFEGIPVIGLNFWDRNIRNNQDSGSKWNKPHRALLTTVDELMIGLEEESDLSTIDAFNEKKTRELFIDFGYNIDAKINQDFMVQVAY